MSATERPEYSGEGLMSATERLMFSAERLQYSRERLLSDKLLFQQKQGFTAQIGVCVKKVKIFVKLL
jgi:hypothetical protein